VEQPRPTFGQFALYLWRLSRPEVWYFALVPMYIGFLLASHELVPGIRIAVDFVHEAAAGGATFKQFVDAVAAWLQGYWRFLVACLVMGPLLWTATLLINDVHDLAGDRVNPRKARSPLVQGLVDRGWAHATAYVFAALSLVAAAAVGWVFFAFTAACVVLAWMYSVPPIRLKTVPGADVALNVVAAGVLAGLAGWSLAAPLSQAPYPFIPQALLVGAAIYIPTALVDYDADLEVGYTTIATKLGRRRAFLLGWTFWVLANIGAVLLSYEGWFIPRRMLPILLVFTPILLIQYWILIGRARAPEEMLRGITVCSATFLAVNGVFALMYTGWWV
jgi:chlorophyll synthase